MVVFCCPHIGAIYEVFTLRYLRCKKEDTVLITTEQFAKSEYADRLVKNGVLKKIVADKMNVRPYCSSEEALLNAIVRHYDALLLSNEINLKDASELYLWADVENLFSIYLSAKGQRHTLVEMDAGQFKKDSRYSGNAKLLGYGDVYESLHRKYFALNGEGGNLIRRIFIGEKDKKIDDKDETIHFTENFASLPKEAKVALVESFGVQKFCGEDYSLFLLNSSGYTLLRSEGGVIASSAAVRERYYLVYQIIIDYLADEHFCVKDHPQTHNFDFEHAFPGEKIIPGIVPIEFFTLAKDFKLNRIYSVNSTGGDKLAGRAKESVRLGDVFLREFRCLHRLWAAFSLASLVAEENTRFHYCGIDKHLLDNADKYMFGNLWKEGELHGVNPEILSGNIYVFVGADGAKCAGQLRKALCGASRDMRAVFLDKRAIPFSAQESEDEILPYIVPIRIRKMPVGKTVSGLEDEYIYFYCKDGAIREKAAKFSAARALRNTGIEIAASADTGEFADLRGYARSIRIGQLEEKVSELRAELKALSDKFDAMADFFASMDKKRS